MTTVADVASWSIRCGSAIFRCHKSPTLDELSGLSYRTQQVLSRGEVPC